MGSTSNYLVDNPHLASMHGDQLFHLGLPANADDLKPLFSDVKFVIVGGSSTRMGDIASNYYGDLKQLIPDLAPPKQFSSTDRYALYKVGPILTCSHGIGIDSMSVVLNELFKLLHHAGCSDVEIFRCGTSGGIGVEPGSVVITSQPVNGLGKPEFHQYILLKTVTRVSKLDDSLTKELKSVADDLQIPAVLGKTMSCRGFYEEQARLNGAFCEYSEKDHKDFLEKLHDDGVRNFEMEAVAFAAMTFRVNIKSAVLCCALLNRFQGDTINAPHETCQMWEQRPAKIVLEHIKRKLNLN